MFSETYGGGARAFLAIHGWGGTHRDFAPLARRLPRDARLLAVDLPGHGQSPPPERWDLSAITDDLVRLIEERGLREPTLAGFCSGAVLALMAAQRAPGRVARVVLIDPFAFVPWYFRMFLAGAAGRAAYRTAFASAVGRRITTWVLRRRQGVDDDFMGAFATVNHEASLAWMKLFHDLGGIDRFAGLSLPVDIARGERTFAAVRASIRKYRAVLPHSRVVELRGVGHLPLVRGARQLADLLFDSDTIGGTAP